MKPWEMVIKEKKGDHIDKEGWLVHKIIDTKEQAKYDEIDQA